MRLLLVEDEQDLGTAIVRSLRQEAYLVDWAKDGIEAWNYLQASFIQYELAIFDWLLPRLSGLELCQQLRSHHKTLPVLMLTAKDSLEERVMGLDAGADDYLVKPFGMVELLARLRALQRRPPQYQSPQLMVGCFTLNYGNRTVSRQGRVSESQSVQLTIKEFQLLEYFMKHPHQVVTRNQIINQVWEVEIDYTSNVVAAQVRLLRRKLAEIGADTSITTVWNVGYQFKPDYENR